MKAKDEVCNISAHLPPITDRMHSEIVERHKQLLLKSWDGKTKRKEISKWSFTIWTYRGDYQILRTFTSHIEWRNRRTEMVEMAFAEVAQWYYNVKTNKEYNIMRPYYWATRDFSYHKPMRYNDCKSDFAKYISGVEGVPIGNISIHPLIRRNGLSAKMVKGVETDTYVRSWLSKLVIERIMQKPFFETLIKSINWRLVSESSIDRYEKPLRLCIRYGINLDPYFIRDFVDSIQMMDEEHIDWHNRKHLTAWREIHDRIVEMRNRLEEERKAMQYVQFEAEFAEKRKLHIGICFVVGDIKFKSLDSVKEYREEGKQMHHCVGGYWNHYNSICFAITDEVGHKLATLEFNIEQKKIIQCRAYCNKVPERYNEIINSFENNIRQWLPQQLQTTA